MDHHALSLGTMLAGEYRIEKLLGEGGFGLTYLAWDTRLEVKVAIKEYLPDTLAMRLEGRTVVAKSQATKSDYNWGLQSFLKEAKALARYRDQNIVHILRYFETNGTAYIVMEYCEGGCLNDRIKKGEKLSETVLQSILTPLMNSLQLVHDDGVYHRDIKPDNIMFRADGTPVLIDFGAARQAVGTKTQTASSMCTPPYAAWEQYQSNGNVGPWTDIYGLAAVAYESLTGKRPPESASRIPNDSIKSLSSGNNGSDFIKAIDWGLKVFEDERPQTLADWYTALQSPDYSQLDPLIEFAGADAVITAAEMNYLQDKARKLGLSEKASLDYIIRYAVKHNWKLHAEDEDKRTQQSSHKQSAKQSAKQSKSYGSDYSFKNSNDWYPIFQQAMLKGDDNCCIQVPNDFPLPALDQLLKAANEVNLHSLRLLPHHTTVAIGAHIWFGQGEYPLIIISCHQDKVHVCIAETSFEEGNDDGLTQELIEIVAYGLELNRHHLVSQLDVLLKSCNLNPKDIEHSFIYGDIDFLHPQLEGYFAASPIDQSHLKNFVPADAGLKRMNAVLKGEITNYLLINISSHTLALRVGNDRKKSKDLITLPGEAEFASALPGKIRFYFLLHKQELWITESLEKLTAHSKPLCALPYDSEHPLTNIEVMHKEATGKLVPYKELSITKLQKHEAIKVTVDYKTNGQIKITKSLIERL